MPHGHGAQKGRGKEGTNQADYAAGRFLTLQQYAYKRLRERARYGQDHACLVCVTLE